MGVLCVLTLHTTMRCSGARQVRRGRGRPVLQDVGRRLPRPQRRRDHPTVRRVRVRICTRLRTRARMRAHICNHAHPHTHALIHTHTHTHRHADAHTHTHTHTHARTHTHTRFHTPNRISRPKPTLAHAQDQTKQAVTCTHSSRHGMAHGCTEEPAHARAGTTISSTWSPIRVPIME